MTNTNKSQHQREQEESRRTPERQAWLDNLKVGDMVMYVMSETSYRKQKIKEILSDVIHTDLAVMGRDGESTLDYLHTYLMPDTPENELMFKRARWKESRITRIAKKLKEYEDDYAEWMLDDIEKMLKLGKLKEPK